jgi:hypothetical protein
LPTPTPTICGLLNNNSVNRVDERLAWEIIGEQLFTMNCGKDYYWDVKHNQRIGYNTMTIFQLLDRKGEGLSRMSDNLKMNKMTSLTKEKWK